MRFMRKLSWNQRRFKAGFVLKIHGVENNRYNKNDNKKKMGKDVLTTVAANNHGEDTSNK